MQVGVPIPPVRIIQVMSEDEWEEFTEEALSHLKARGDYEAIRRVTGAGDLGLDVVAFTSESAGFAKPWDSFQCKHYDHALRPGDVCPEIAKIIYHSFYKTPPFNQACRLPRFHKFIAPQGVGLSVSRLLRDPDRLREEVRARWTKCMSKIGKNVTVALAGKFLEYFDQFDFGIFGDMSAVELIQWHSETVFYTPRFGMGLPARGAVPAPPSEPSASESVYLRKILDAYGDDLGQAISGIVDIDTNGPLKGHYERQRVLFYSAEELRNFARDRTPRMTFESLQEDVFNGVIDTHDAQHENGLERLRVTITTAGKVDVAGNALVSVTRVADKQGICHQLANDDRLTWTKKL
jgi:hypothetical protein